MKGRERLKSRNSSGLEVDRLIEETDKDGRPMIPVAIQQRKWQSAQLRSDVERHNLVKKQHGDGKGSINHGDGRWSRENGKREPGSDVMMMMMMTT